MAAAKTCITEICSKENEGRAFSYLNGVWGMGLIAGPCLGGLLSRPAIQYPEHFAKTGIWGIYPYLLPCFLCSIIAVVAFILLYSFFPETGGKFMIVNGTV